MSVLALEDHTVWHPFDSEEIPELCVTLVTPVPTIQDQAHDNSTLVLFRRFEPNQRSIST